MNTTPANEWREEVIGKYLAKQTDYVGDVEDLTSVCLDGWFDLLELADLLLTTHSAHLVERNWEIVNKVFRWYNMEIPEQFKKDFDQAIDIVKDNK